MQAMKEMQKKKAFRHRKTETKTIQLYMVYIGYKRRIVSEGFEKQAYPSMSFLEKTKE